MFDDTLDNTSSRHLQRDLQENVVILEPQCSSLCPESAVLTPFGIPNSDFEQQLQMDLQESNVLEEGSSIQEM